MGGDDKEEDESSDSEEEEEEEEDVEDRNKKNNAALVEEDQEEKEDEGEEEEEGDEEQGEDEADDDAEEDGEEVKMKDNDGVSDDHLKSEATAKGASFADDKKEQSKGHKTKGRPVHKLSLTQTHDFNAQLKRRGVVYVARIPPRMTPTKMKRLLQEELITSIDTTSGGKKSNNKVEITRIYLVPEDASVRKRRRQEHGGNGSKRFVEGWIEFASKRVAKQVAAALHNTPISNHKRNAHYGDLWNLKYLSKFTWSHLTEKVAYERRVQEQKLRLETMQARKETAAYKHLVETGQTLDKIEQRRQKRKQQQQHQMAEQSQEGEQQQNPAIHKRSKLENKFTNDNKKHRPAKQVQPTHDGAEKATHWSVLGSLV
ncbi:hypothetical protein ACA910_014738 [Epithemia clementina (nom. ined.)]